MTRKQLLEKINKMFSAGELATLCFDIDVDYDSISGDTRNDKARELLLHCGRRGMMGELVEGCKSAFPNEEWD